MTYYPTIDEDLARAKEILAKGNAELTRIWSTDNEAAYKLLESFVQHIEYVHQQVEACHNHIDELEKFKEHAIRLNKKAAAEIEQLREGGKVEKLEDAATALGQEWKRVAAERDEARAENEELHESIANLDDQVVSLRAENLKWQDEHTGLKLDYQNVEAERDYLRELVEAVGEDICKLALRQQQRAEKDEQP